MLPVQPADKQSRYHPSGRAKYPDQRKIFTRVFHLLKRYRIDQGQCRHINDHIGKNPRVKGRKIWCNRFKKQQYRADNVQHAKYLLRREISIRDKTDNKRRNNGTQCLRSICAAILSTGRVQRCGQIRPHRYKPCAPDKKLQEHHGRQLETNERRHYRTLSSDYFFFSDRIYLTIVCASSLDI